MMSSIKDMILGLIELIFGDGDVKSQKQGFILIAFDKVMTTIENILKS